MVTMTTRELKNCNWEVIGKARAKQILNACEKHGMKGIFDELTSICQSISAVTNLPYNEVFEIFKFQNGLFYHHLERFQRNLILYGTADFTLPLSYLVLPDISPEKNAIECLSLFFSLTTDEKDSVLKGMQTYASSLN